MKMKTRKTSEKSTPKKRGPYRKKFTTEGVIRALEKSKGMITHAAKLLKCHPDTIRNYIRDIPEVAKAVADQREGFLDDAENALHQAVIRGEGWAVCFMLKTIGRERGYKEKQEIEVVNIQKVLIERAQELNIDVSTDPLLSAIFTTLGIKPDRAQAHGASGPGPTH